MSHVWGAVCVDCLDAYLTPKWGPPFRCPVCSYNQQKADELLAYLNYRRRMGDAA